MDAFAEVDTKPAIVKNGWRMAGITAALAGSGDQPTASLRQAATNSRPMQLSSRLELAQGGQICQGSTLHLLGFANPNWEAATAHLPAQ